jgi:hypothetical protein
MNVERHIIAERGVEQVDDIGDVGLERGRRGGDAGIVADVDLHGNPIGCRSAPDDSPRLSRGLGLTGVVLGWTGAAGSRRPRLNRLQASEKELLLPFGVI